ncbi:Zn-binding domain-containing protein, partial [Magnetococcales bacterium HHB-1]
SAYQVEKLDWEGRKAFVKPTKNDYYTDAIDYVRLTILDSFDQVEDNFSTCDHGETRLVRRVAGYKKIRYYTHENVGFGNINLPDQTMHTTAVWWRLHPDHLKERLGDRQVALDGFLGAAYALHVAAAALSMSELRDLGRAVGDGESQWFAVTEMRGRGVIRTDQGETINPEDLEGRFSPVIFLYDNFPGGVGLSEPLFKERDRIAKRALEMVTGCDCQLGCPACVGPIVPLDQERRLSPREAAVETIKMILSDHPQTSEDGHLIE